MIDVQALKVQWHWEPSIGFAAASTMDVEARRAVDLFTWKTGFCMDPLHIIKLPDGNLLSPKTVNMMS